MTILVDYGAGNTRSVMNALDRIGAPYILSSDHKVIANAERLILPGVGHAGAAMSQLRAYDLISVLRDFQKPLLGICLGMQLLFEFSEEGSTICLGLLTGKIKKFTTDGPYKVPHMGWNDFVHDQDHYIFDGLCKVESAYFVHSYFAEISDYTLASCHYIKPFSAVIVHGNRIGMQFHPEKSGMLGHKLLSNFIHHTHA